MRICRDRHVLGGLAVQTTCLAAVQPCTVGQCTHVTNLALFDHIFDVDDGCKLFEYVAPCRHNNRCVRSGGRIATCGAVQASEH